MTTSATTDRHPGVLLINLGTPDSASVRDVRRYLAEFLMDPRVIDIPGWKRWLLVHGIILRTRPKQSAHAYQSIWDPERGSPLRFHSEDLRDALAAKMPETKVALAMRYGKPSMATALAELDAAGVDRIVALPMFPQYSSAASGSAIEHLYRGASREAVVPSIDVIGPFYDHPGYIDSLAAQAGPTLEAIDAERILISFHGIPMRQCRTAARNPAACGEPEACCAQITHENAGCYRAQCVRTAELLAAKLGLPESRYEICFQSRLGSEPWCTPYTDERVRALGQQGIKSLAILSPSFLADCLETVEELGIRARADFTAAGGQTLHVLPALNASDAWVCALADMVRTRLDDGAR